MAKQTKSRKQAYRHPGTGDARKSRKPLRIDRLPQTVKDFIISAHEAGESWKRIEEMASAAAGIHLSHSTLHRWYDLRIEQQTNTAALREIISLLKKILKAVSQ